MIVDEKLYNKYITCSVRVYLMDNAFLHDMPPPYHTNRQTRICLTLVIAKLSTAELILDILEEVMNGSSSKPFSRKKESLIFLRLGDGKGVLGSEKTRGGRRRCEPYPGYKPHQLTYYGSPRLLYSRSDLRDVFAASSRSVCDWPLRGS